ncbi:histone deacetylase family protein [Thalassococcus sp. CAU 1522]|uniref:Histone deacetylase family protein n=1 Tax=Thalassococcus arenae TaxID=2851652 RepID=A0ABS6NCF3_9RHOB|nr:histone deacetylase family protein [Thalassococcus arenae]MBV2361706.1 histone deacetylase family protein [Thalassococcus arenae]
MKAFLDPRQSRHDPRMFLKAGVPRPNPEAPGRVDRLREGALAAGCTLVAPRDNGSGPIAAIHPAEYLDFLATAHDRWQSVDGASDEVIPNVHPSRHAGSRPDGIVGQAGWHMADTACPIAADTWTSAYWSAQTALGAADAALQDGVAYALCRPPGHHAFADMAGGFCFLNNAAIAAQSLTTQGRRVAIIDIDVHHGNGTQGIFYQRGDVLTVSVHADPAAFYPFFWGHAHERGAGPGEGANLNLPLPFGTGDDGFLAAVETACGRIALFGADSLVVSLGLDAHEGDPFRALAVTTPGFSRIAARLADLRLPSVLVQEGGYLQPALGDNLAHFLTGWSTAP